LFFRLFPRLSYIFYQPFITGKNIHPFAIPERQKFFSTFSLKYFVILDSKKLTPEMQETMENHEQ